MNVERERRILSIDAWGGALTGAESPGGQAQRIDATSDVGMIIEAYGATFGLMAPNQGWLDRFHAVLPSPWRLGRDSDVYRWFRVREGSKGRYTFEIDDVEVAVDDRAEDMVEIAEGHIRLYVAEYAADWVFIHAGAVGYRGNAIILPGRSMSGKTTLVSALLQAGAEYMSDEFAVFDPEGRVHPFPKPLSMRRPGDWRQASVDASAYGARCVSGPLPLGLVVLSRYVPGGSAAQRVLTAGAAVLRLFDNAPAAQRAGATVLDRMALAIDNAQALELDRGEAPAAASAILHFLDEVWD